MAIMFTKDLDVDSVIEKSDLDGCILNEDQYEKYTNISTYIDENGEEVTPELISWDDVDSVIGKRVTSDVKKGALVYDTTITSQHVIAQKTYVDATVNGEDGTYEVENGVLPGNTKIQINAVHLFNAKVMKHRSNVFIIAPHYGNLVLKLGKTRRCSCDRICVLIDADETSVLP